MALTILTDPADLVAVRAIAGVTAADLSDATIDSAPYGQHAELLMRDPQDGLTAQQLADALAGDDDDLKLALHLAAQYMVAALFAEQKAKGGVIGNVSPSQTTGRTPADWDRLAELWWGYGFRYRDWAVAHLEDPDVDPTPVYQVTSIVVANGGPRRRKAPWAPWTG